MSALIFELSMPGVASWNGHWSGEDRCYAIVKPIRPTKKHRAKCEQIVAAGPYSYAWNDGWRASVAVRIVEGNEARRIRKASQGFCGYDWMADSIYWHGEILDAQQRRERTRWLAHTP